MMTDNTQRIATLKAKLKGRENVPGYEENVKHIKEEVARLENGG